MQTTKTFRPIPGLSREEEEKRLAEIIDVAQENLEKTEKRIRALSDELYDLMETYGAKDKEALSLLHNTQSQLHERKRELLRCRKARRKPYFGRIDFKDPKVPWEESYYVGRVGISENGSDPVVVDWRAPVASVYYENSLGPCEYTVKNVGICRIDLKRKRTYEIAEDRLKDFFDSDVVANDELLNKYLAKNKRAVLGEIIATIQKEQNGIIRRSPKTNLIVQGVAGSGKTTVAMHRISYILYNYDREFKPEDFYIIGSNRMLLNYITGVLPELDVYGVQQMTMEQLFVRLLYEDWDPAQYAIRPIDRKDPAARIKGSREWFGRLEKFCADYERAAIPEGEVRIEKNGVLLMDGAAIRSVIENSPGRSMQEKIDILNETLMAKLENETTGKYVSYTAAEKKELRRTYRWHFGRAPWKGSVFELYRDFRMRQSENGLSVPFEENRFDVYDLAALAYLYKRIKENDGIREASHVIIDEAQDFGMMAYEALSYCLRGCTYTIMGDVSQNIFHGYGLDDWKELKELILTGPFDSFGILKKSYRNTVEISGFAAEILRHGSFSIYPAEPIIRHGNEVRVTECADAEAMEREAEMTIRNWQQEGHETIAVICRDEAEAFAVTASLGRRIPLAANDMETAEFGAGVMVLPVEYTKGLEFDAVLLYGPSKEKYPAEDGHVKLLYVAATRALHELAVLHTGDLTELIAMKADEEKRMESLEESSPSVVVSRAAAPVPVNPGGDLHEKREILERKRSAAAGTQPVGAVPASAGRGGAGQTTAGTFGVSGRTIGRQPVPAARTHAGPGNVPAPGSQTGQRPVPAVRRHAERGNVPASGAPVNPSPYQFFDVPENALLRPRGHSRIDTAIKIVKKTKQYLELVSSYGILRLTPVSENVIRVQFTKDKTKGFVPCYWDRIPESSFSWSAREGKNLVEAATEKLTVWVDKKTGAVLFYDKGRRLLLAEKAALPRQIETGKEPEAWMYFDWAKKEKLFAKGILPDQLERVDQKARYISFGRKAMRMPLIVSEYGYGIGVAAEQTAMCCGISMYGPYIYTAGAEQTDYYFLYGGSREAVLELYKRLNAGR